MSGHPNFDSKKSEPQCVTSADLYEHILGRKVEEIEKQELWDKAIKLAQDSEWNSFNTRSPAEVNRVFYEPGNPHAWGDPAIIYHNGTYHFIYLCLTPSQPLCQAISTDGIHWQNAEAVLECDPDLTLLNTPTLHKFQDDGPYVLEYTATHPASFSIRRIATSVDLKQWHKIKNLTYFLPSSETIQHDGNARFEGNYVLIDGNVERPGNVASQENGWYYGVSCGCTLQRSKDGIHWEPAGRLQLNIPTPAIHQADGKLDTITGFFKFNDRYFVICPSYRELMNHSRVYSSSRLEGPYTPTPHHSILGDFFAYYPRFGVGPDGAVLASVDFNEYLHMWDRKGDTKKHFVIPPFEQLICEGEDLWLKYWPGNERLKADPISLETGALASHDDRLINLIAKDIDFSKGVVIEGVIDFSESDREADLAQNANVTATGTIQPREDPEAFRPENAVSNDLDTRWVANIHEDEPMFTLDLGEQKVIGRVRIHWGLSWSESEVCLQVSNNGRDWEPFPGVLAQPSVRYVLLYETERAIQARFLRLSQFKNDRGMVGIRMIQVFSQCAECLGENLQSPGLFIDCQNDRPGWAIIFDNACRVRMGYLSTDGTHFNYPLERDLTLLKFGKRANFRLIQRDRFFFFYINDYALSWLSLSEIPSGEIGVIRGGEGKITNLRVWYALTE
ncbi:discoidin domain-containing protein [Chloroflexi bacterium TSY]|nr:discoidin domain-containing protein [Chloroflexi bacterium TSY]